MSDNDTGFVALVKQTVKEWQEDKASRLAAALAYYTVFSIPPLLVLVIAIAGIVWGQQSAQQQIQQSATGMLGEQGGSAISGILENAERPGNQELIPALISIVLLFFGASGVFVQLQDAMDTIWDVMPRPDLGITGTIRKRLFSFGMVLVIGFLLLVSLVLSAAIGGLGNQVGDIIPGGQIVAWVINFVISLVIVGGLFAFIFKVIPDVEVGWRSVWVGALVTAFLFKLGEFALGLYFQFSNPGSAYGAAGSIIVILFWVYFSAMILFLGAEFTQVYAKQRGHAIRPDDDAMYIPGEERAKQGIPKREQVQAAHHEARGAD